VVDAAGRIAWIHRARSIDDRPAPKQILAAARR
jgi:hypothetical protein